MLCFWITYSIRISVLYREKNVGNDCVIANNSAKNKTHKKIWEIDFMDNSSNLIIPDMLSKHLRQSFNSNPQLFQIYFSLLMIISGVVISSFTEVLFDLSGLISALLSTMSTALLSVYAKKVS